MLSEYSSHTFFSPAQLTSFTSSKLNEISKFHEILTRDNQMLSDICYENSLNVSITIQQRYSKKPN